MNIRIRPKMNGGIDENVNSSGSMERTLFGVLRQPISAPIRLPAANVMSVANVSKPTVHGTARPIISSTRDGNWVSE